MCALVIINRLLHVLYIITSHIHAKSARTTNLWITPDPNPLVKDKPELPGLSHQNDQINHTMSILDQGFPLAYSKLMAIGIRH